MNAAAGDASHATAAATSSGVPSRPSGGERADPLLDLRRLVGGAAAVDRAGRDGVHPDAAVGVVERGRARQPHDTVLGCRVGAHPRCAREPRRRHDVDHAAAVGQRGELVAHRDQDAAQRDAEHPVDVVEGQVAERCRPVGGAGRWAVPALLTAVVMPASAASATRRCIASSSAASVGIARAVAPLDRSSSVSCTSLPASREASTRSAPCSASARATAPPDAAVGAHHERDLPGQRAAHAPLRAAAPLARRCLVGCGSRTAWAGAGVPWSIPDMRSTQPRRPGPVTHPW